MEITGTATRPNLDQHASVRTGTLHATLGPWRPPVSTDHPEDVVVLQEAQDRAQRMTTFGLVGGGVLVLAAIAGAVALYKKRTGHYPLRQNGWRRRSRRRNRYGR